MNSDEMLIRANAALQAVAEQRDAYANAVVNLRAELAVISRRLEETMTPPATPVQETATMPTEVQ